MEVLIPLLAVGGFFTMLILWRSFTNKERMAMIEKGTDAGQFKGMFSGTNKSLVLVIAGLAIGAGVGILLANLLESNLNMDEVVYPALIFICGGIGLIFGRKMANKEDN